MRGPELLDAPTSTSVSSYGVTSSLGTAAAAAVVAGVAAARVSRWWVGALVALFTFAAARLTRGRILLAAGAPVALALGALLEKPTLGWVAIGLLLGDLVAGWWVNRRR
jgi:hypothetical protein